MSNPPAFKRYLRMSCIALTVSGCTAYPNQYCGPTSNSTKEELIERTKFFLKHNSSPVAQGFSDIETTLKANCCYVIDRKYPGEIDKYFPFSDRISYAVFISWKGKGEFVGHQWISGYTCELENVYSSIE